MISHKIYTILLIAHIQDVTQKVNILDEFVPINLLASCVRERDFVLPETIF